MRTLPIRTLTCACLAGVCCLVLALNAARSPQPVSPNQADQSGRVTLANGWRLTPAGFHIALPGDMPGNMALTPDSRYMFVNTCGYHDHSVNVIDLSSQKVIQTINVKNNWIGLDYDPLSSTLTVSGAAATSTKKKKKNRSDAASSELPDNFANSLLRFHWDGKSLTPLAGLPLPGNNGAEAFVSGVTSAGNGSMIVVNSQSDEVLQLNITDGSLKQKVKVGYRPFAAILSPDGTTLAVSNWGDGTVSLVDAASFILRSSVTVGAQPGALAYAKDGRLFVANSGANTVSVVKNSKVVETIRTSINNGPATGTTPSALVISKDGTRLYVANADNNCVAAVDISGEESRVAGFIPTGRYPSSLALGADGRKLYIGTAKGLTFSANAEATSTSTTDTYQNYVGYSGEKENKGIRFDYVGGILAGNVSVVDVPDAHTLASYTAQVRANSPLGLAATVNSAERRKIQAGALSKIKHIVYVIKENRTYDQVLGDIAKGNGAPNLTIFGEKVTPNMHRLVNQFALFDNLYCDGEVSQVGHQWTDSAYATDFTEKAWVMSYSGRGQLVADTRLSSSPAGFIWNDAEKHGKSYRIYGEYMQYSGEHDDAPPQILQDPEKYHFSGKFEEVHKAGGRDPEKVDVFIDELKAAEAKNTWPSLMVIALPEDHTKGLKAGAHSPRAMVGSNDLAVGKLVDAISHSKFWPETAIFIIQDDAQNGPDHMDAHRTVGTVISPYVNRGIVDHTMYSTSSMLRTMELMLGLPPMTQYDAAATPMYATFTTKADFSPYTYQPAKVDLDEMNPEGTKLARLSAQLDFSELDKADPDLLNRILWEALKPGVKMPAPVHGIRP